MSAREIEVATRQFFSAFSQSDSKAAAALLSEDLEVIDHVPYRFDSKAEFVEFLDGFFAGVKSSSAQVRQLSCRMIGDAAGVANAYDTFTAVGKDGKPITGNGRTTLVFGKEENEWKIVSCHFSPLPTHG